MSLTTPAHNQSPLPFQPNSKYWSRTVLCSRTPPRPPPVSVAAPAQGAAGSSAASGDQPFARGQDEEQDDDDDDAGRHGSGRMPRPRGLPRAPTDAENRDRIWGEGFSESFATRLQAGVCFADGFGKCELCGECDGAAAVATAVTISCESCRLHSMCLRCDRERHARYPSLCCRWAVFADGQQRNLGPEEFVSRVPVAADERADGDGGVDGPSAAPSDTRLCVSRTPALRCDERAAQPFCETPLLTPHVFPLPTPVVARARARFCSSCFSCADLPARIAAHARRVLERLLPDLTKGVCAAGCLLCQREARLVPDQRADARDLVVWTAEGATVKRALRIECLSCKASRPLEALDYHARFQWVALSPAQGSVFLDLPTLKFLCVRLRPRAWHASPLRCGAALAAARVCNPIRSA